MSGRSNDGEQGAKAGSDRARRRRSGPASKPRPTRTAATAAPSGASPERSGSAAAPSSRTLGAERPKGTKDRRRQLLTSGVGPQAKGHERPTTAAGKQRGRPRKGAAESEARRRQILAAALSEFSEHGFEAARLDDIARRAKVAKGTLYIYFPDKQALFEALIRSATAPLLMDLGALAGRADLTMHSLLAELFQLFRREVLGTERKLIVRLVIAEGPRFPEIARFHHREVVSRIIAALQAVARRAHASGELTNDALVRFPQLIAAPLLMSIVWDGLFQRFDPLDVEGLLDAHLALLTGQPGVRR